MGGARWVPISAVPEVVAAAQQLGPSEPQQVVAPSRQPMPDHYQAEHYHASPYGVAQAAGAVNADPYMASAGVMPNYSPQVPAHYYPPSPQSYGVHAPAAPQKQSVPVIDWVVPSMVGLVGLAVGLASRSIAFPLVVASGLCVYADAHANGIRRKPDSKGMFNMNPLGWSMSVIFLAIIGLPAYVALRSGMRTAKGTVAFFVLTIFSSLLLLLVVVVSIAGVPFLSPSADALSQGLQAELPKCDSGETTASLRQIIDRAAANRERGVTVTGFGTPVEIRFDRTSE